MAIPRSRLLPGRPAWVHVISRCVRKAYLCGGRDGKWDHRRQWVEEQLRDLAAVFAVEVAAYAVMSNHVHAVVRMSPEVAARWTDAEVVARWLTVFGKNAERLVVNGARDPMTQMFAQDAAWAAERRARLADLSWFMRAFKEPLARRANQEDECSGRFWEGRYTSVPLLDQAALVACMAYVDLNPVRARMATTPEASAFTSVRQRVQARQRQRAAQRPRESVARASPDVDLFVAPLARCRHVVEGVPTSSWTLSTDEYLTLVDLTGRVIRQGKRGAIDPRLPALLSRLDLRVEDWITTMVGWRQMHGSGVGHAASRADAAASRGLRWIRNRCTLFAGGSAVA